MRCIHHHPIPGYIPLLLKKQKDYGLRMLMEIFFSNSGTEAVEAAMKLARFNTRKQYFIAFYGAFHGRTLGSMSLTASKKSQKVGFGAPFPGALHVPYADCYRCVYNRKLEECSYECIQFIKDYV